jgi:hypothetical protein
MADVKHCTASPINDFEGFLHIFYCRINFTESLTEKLLCQVGWQGRVQNNRNSPHDVRSPDCWVLTQTHSPNFSLLASWWAMVSFTEMVVKKVSLFFFNDYVDFSITIQPNLTIFGQHTDHWRYMSIGHVWHDLDLIFIVYWLNLCKIFAI